MDFITSHEALRTGPIRKELKRLDSAATTARDAVVDERKVFFGDGAGWADADGQSGQLDGHAADQLRLPVAALRLWGRSLRGDRRQNRLLEVLKIPANRQERQAVQP